MLPSERGSFAVTLHDNDDARLAAMRARLNADVANGLVGQLHNTLRHRTRVLAQLTKAARQAETPPPPLLAEPQQ